MITTDVSLEGTIDTSSTTITTNTPDIATSVIPPGTTSINLTPTSTSSYFTQTISSTTNSGNAEITVTPSTYNTNPQTTSSLSLVLTTANTGLQSSENVITTTIITGSLTTKTYVITTTSALVLIVTETKTETATSTITINIPYVDYSTSTTIYPISTYTSSSLLFNGYYNVSSVLYSEHYSTEYRTDYIQLENTYDYEKFEYYTYTFEEVVTSTFVVFETGSYESYSLTTGYNTIISTLYPTSYITVITSTPSATDKITTTTPIITSSKTNFHSTVTVTNTHIVTITVSPTHSAGTCETQETAVSILAESIFSGHAYKVQIHQYLFNFGIALFALL